MKIINWLKNNLSERKYLRKSYIHKLFGERIFASEVWRVNRRSLASGLSLGLFIAFLPIIPFQMLSAAIGAIYFKINLPIALAACWVTNPVTIYPVYWAAKSVGKWVLGILPAVVYNNTAVGSMGQFVTDLWIGSIIFALLAAVVGNLLVRGVWRYVTVRAWRIRKGFRKPKDG